MTPLVLTENAILSVFLASNVATNDQNNYISISE